MGKTERLPEQRCPACGKVLDAATVVDQPQATPKPGSVAICLDCAYVAVFTDELTLRDPTPEENKVILANYSVQVAVWGVRKLRGLE